MSCDNNWRTMQGHMWKPGQQRDDRWEAFKNAWAEDHNVFFDFHPWDHVHKHVLWDDFQDHLTTRDGLVTKSGNLNPTSYFTGLHALDQALRDFMDANTAEMAAKEALGQGEVKGIVSSSTGEYFGMSYHTDSSRSKSQILVGLCQEAFVKMHYWKGCWNVRTAFPENPML